MSSIVSQLTGELINRFKTQPVLLKAAGLHKIYKKDKKEVRALCGVDLEVKKGEILVIIGPSGAGKSTLLHILGGLDRPTGGQVLLEGTNFYEVSDSRRARLRNEKIGFVFQFYHLLPEFSALENVMLAALISKKEKKNTIAKRAAEILTSVGLGKRINFKPGELSGGEAQRVAIARALINRPDLVLCDEPTGNLDSKTSGEICGLIERLNKEKQATFVIVTHELSLKNLATRVLHIKDGRFQ